MAHELPLHPELDCPRLYCQQVSVWWLLQSFVCEIHNHGPGLALVVSLLMTASFAIRHINLTDWCLKKPFHHVHIKIKRGRQHVEWNVWLDCDFGLSWNDETGVCSMTTEPLPPRGPSILINYAFSASIKMLHYIMFLTYLCHRLNFCHNLFNLTKTNQVLFYKAQKKKIWRESSLKRKKTTNISPCCTCTFASAAAP